MDRHRISCFGIVGVCGRIKTHGIFGGSGIESAGSCFFSVWRSVSHGRTVLGLMVSRKKKLHNELLENGTKVNGTVEKVCVEMGVRYGGKAPYTVIYTFSHQGKEYHRESCFLWDKPDVKEHDSIVVYTDDSGKSAVQL